MSKTVSYYQCDRKEMLAFIPNGASRILDVGCGAGRFGALLAASSNAEVWGVEPEVLAADEAKANLHRVLVGSFPDAVSLPEHFFDVVVFNDVLEHMIDPRNALEAAKTLLAPGGVVVASIPNIRYLPVLYRLVVQGDWKYQESGALDETHLRFFTRKSAERLFRDAGFSILRRQGINPYRRWQVSLAMLVAPWLACEARYIEFAFVALPRSDRPEDHSSGASPRLGRNPRNGSAPV